MVPLLFAYRHVSLIIHLAGQICGLFLRTMWVLARARCVFLFWALCAR